VLCDYAYYNINIITDLFLNLKKGSTTNNLLLAFWPSGLPGLPTLGFFSTTTTTNMIIQKRKKKQYNFEMNSKNFEMVYYLYIVLLPWKISKVHYVL